MTCRAALMWLDKPEKCPTHYNSAGVGSPFTLHLGEAHIDLHLLLGRKLFLHLCLQSAEEEWPQDCVQPVH